jgi:hypothetical protein
MKKANQAKAEEIIRKCEPYSTHPAVTYTVEDVLGFMDELATHSEQQAVKKALGLIAGRLLDYDCHDFLEQEFDRLEPAILSLLKEQP